MMRDVRLGVATLAATVVLMGPTMTRAQGIDATGGNGAVTARQDPATAPAKRAIQRWFDLEAASLMARYRRVETSGGTVTNNHLQDSVALKARVNFDAKADYTVTAAVATGSTFTSGWNNTGLGEGGRRVTNLYLKQLFFAATPVRGVQFSAGGFGIVRGESTEITSYDNDGYLAGERVSVRRPARLYFDEIALTNAYLGDLDAPGFTRRYRRFDEPNYRQVLVGKRVGGWLGVSGDYTRLHRVGTLRAAFTLKTSRLHVADLVQWEQYRRGGDDAAFGFAVSGAKTVAGRVLVRAGFADIDRAYGGLNADRFNSGRRWYAQADVAITDDFAALVFVSHTVHNAFVVPNASRIDIVFSYNAMGPLRRAGLIR